MKTTDLGLGGQVSSISWGSGGGGFFGNGAGDPFNCLGTGVGGSSWANGSGGGGSGGSAGGFGGGGSGAGCAGGGGGGGYSGGDGGLVAGGGGSFNAGTLQVATAGVGTGNGSLVIVLGKAALDTTKKTVEVIGKFLAERNNQILANGPDEGRQVDRLIEAGGGNSGSNGGTGFAQEGQPFAGSNASRLAGPDSGDLTRLGFGGHNNTVARNDPAVSGLSVFGRSANGDDQQVVRGPFNISGTNDGAARLGFSTSLRDIYRYKADSEVRKLGAAGVAAGLAPTSVRPYSPLDIWIEGKYATFGDSFQKTSLEGHFGLVSVGVDYVLNKNLLVGLMVQFDSMAQRSNSQLTSIQGNGWLAGPYMTMRLTDNLYWQARAAWGTSSNEVSPLLTYNDSFDSDRWLVSTSLTGRWQMGPWTLKPSASISYIEDKSDSYTDSLGLLIPSVKSTLGQAKAGPEVSYRFDTGPGSFIEPHAGGQLIWNFTQDTTAAGFGTLNGDTVGPEGVRGRIEAGARMGSPSGVSLDISGSYDGIGAGSYHAYLGRAAVRVPLN